MAFTIQFDLCTACGDCRSVCPANAIREGKLSYHIVPERCNECEDRDETIEPCIAVCPVDECIIPEGPFNNDYCNPFS